MSTDPAHSTEGRLDSPGVMAGRQQPEPLIFEKSVPGRRAGTLPPCDVPVRPLAELLPESEIRHDLSLPEVSELDVVRHFTRLSKRNYAVDSEFYPLGSCTMKYNPKLDENVAGLPGFRQLHPLQPEETVQGALRVVYELERMLGEIAGLPGVSAQPVAGASGEFTGILMVRAAHLKRGRLRHKVLIPDSAHGTNPATAAMAGYQAVTVGHDRRTGELDLEDFKAKLDDDCAAIMITVPNTLGLFESQIVEICRLAHEVGCYVYCDGANMNAMVGQVRPGDLGVDLLHINLHKTFAVPHGGGGPGGGAICVTPELEPFLPAPIVVRRAGGAYGFDADRPDTIGRVHGFHGNFNAALRSYTYILSLGKEGLYDVGATAVLNANYLKSRLRDAYRLYVERTCMHEFVLDGRPLREFGLHTLDLAKRLVDYGFHPPTMYFPLIFPEAIMIEPTETESKETLDAFADAMIAIAHEAATQPELLHEAPHVTPVGRLDETRAARQPDLRWHGGIQRAARETAAEAKRDASVQGRF
jgi:glycine dehydrogenase subunit 2